MEVNREKTQITETEKCRTIQKKVLEDISNGGCHFAEAMPLETTDVTLTVSLQKLYT